MRLSRKRNPSKRRLTPSSIFLLTVVTLFSFTLFSHLMTSVASQGNLVYTLDYDQTITVSSSEYLRDGLSQARDAGAQCVILELDTFGGDLDSTKKMIEYMDTSSIPVVVYVKPGGVAWSAGAFLLMGSHVAAMAPGTVVGSSQPVSYSPLGGSTPVTDDKLINALATYIGEKARIHGRNDTIAENFVRRNLNLAAEDAKPLHVIEILAANISDLLQQLNGMNVTTYGGSKVLSTSTAYVVALSRSIPVAFLGVIGDPTISGLLFLIGLYALIYGILTPGYGGEVIGGVLIVLSLIGMGFDFNIVALILIIIGIGLLIGELQTQGVGALGAGGIICVILGSLLLFPRQPPKWLINMGWFPAFATVMLGVGIAMGGIFAVAAYKTLQARAMRSKMFKLEGETATVFEDIPAGEKGYVQCFGELWRATSDYNLKKGDKVKIIKTEGDTLLVEPLAKGKKR